VTLRILLVDDHAGMRRLLRAILQAFGIRKIAEAETVAEALEKLREFQPDIAIVDYLFHQGNGLTFVKAVRGGEIDPLLPIVMVTGSSTGELVAAAREAGVTEFVAKPVRPEALRLRLNEIVLRPRNFIRSATFFGPDRRRNKKAAMPGAVSEDRRRKVDVAPGMLSDDDPLALSDAAESLG